ncbi:MAG: DUF3160 domain-containing protein, partial [Candidatus Methanofastidiosa archaeon]|nr:DUF3160 domain-containing protein [Candidatus Methanofastidiosa archaeon]
EYGFVISPTSNDLLFHDYYCQLKDAGIPIFVTSDSLLHSFHILYDYSLRMAEMESFQYGIMDITLALIERTDGIYDSSSGKVKESAKLNVAFLAIAMKLLDPSYEVPGYVSDIVDEEIELIGSADGISFSPLFGYREDYSQYAPRGHYTRNDELKRYFKAMMWYGRMTFRLKEREQTRAAILLVLSTQGLKAGDRTVMDVWDDIYLTTSFFVGDADDLLIYDYAGVIKDVYGDTVDIGDLNDEALLDEFIEQAKDLPDPRINSSVISDQEDPVDDTKGLRFMGQRFIIDSYMFFELVYDNVLWYYGDGEPFTLVNSIAGPIRGFPRGLDVFSVLGFENAEAILEDEGDTDYEGYDEQIEMLKDEIGQFGIEEWTKNLYTTWTYTLESLSESASEGWPAFMTSELWELKELYTALGSWTELRHDTILYAKQSYTLEATAMPPQDFTKGYVEPQPLLYSRLLSLTRMAKDGLSDRDLLSAEMLSKYENLDSLLQSAIEISEKEIAGEALTESEYRIINDIGAYIEGITTFSLESSEKYESEADSSVALVADVHTDVNSMMVLEEAVGYPYSIFVVVQVEGRVYIAQGPVFSYFEFKHPLDDRLTDEKWQELLEDGEEPELPQWALGFIIE